MRCSTARASHTVASQCAPTSCAWLCDVYVERPARGGGVGLALASAVVNELRPFKLKRVILSTLDAHGLYEKVGFESFPNPERLMLLSAGGLDPSG